MELQVEQSGDIERLTFAGELTVQHSDKLRVSLMRTLDSVNHVFIDLENVTSVDLSCLQLLCSACHSSQKLNKLLTITDKRPEIFKKAIEDAGYSRHVGCASTINKSCLWIENGN
ncbi:STAS domain protein [bacterium BMS3Bbin06]|nr:STAS domain protein [bacterium BMS3Abin08]GBE34552.1 STAS domain protein [bacterium BMS3Bbin06]HDY70207.1 anti-sigma factor antagonist [Nitrospirota bacterium]